MRVSVVADGLHQSNRWLPPWRFLTEMAMGLAAAGHDVEFVTDGPTGDVDLPGVPIWHPTEPGQGHAAETLVGHLRSDRPHLVLWHMTALSALRPRPRVLAGTRHVAVFSSPRYRAVDVLRMGCAGRGDRHAYAVTSLGSLVPRGRLIRVLERSFDATIVLGRSTAMGLVGGGLSAGHVFLVPPGRDRDVAPRSNGWSAAPDEVTFVVDPGPSDHAAADLAMRAFADVRAVVPSARLLIRPATAASSRAAHLADLAEADVVIMPARFVAYDGPTEVLDIAGVGVPLIASDVAPIRDLAAPASILFRPGSRDELSAAMVRFATDERARSAAADVALDWHAAWPTWSETSRHLASVLGIDEPVPESQPAWAGNVAAVSAA